MKNCIAGLAAIGALAAGAMGHDEGDYGLVVIDGKIVTGIGDHDSGTISHIGERVFAAEMSKAFGSIYADEPGIFVQAGTFAPGTGIGFNILAALRVWDTVNQDFFTVSAVPMTIEFGPASVTTPASDSLVSGFNIMYGGGEFDEHWDFLLPSDVDLGIYLLEIQFAVTDPGIAASDAIWTVFNYGLDEDEHELAIEWVEKNLVPAPGSALALLGLGLMGRRRR